MNLSRTVGLVAVAATAAIALTGCGTDTDARTEACRSYLVGGGAGDQELAESLQSLASKFTQDGGGSYEPEPITLALAEVRKGAQAAGTTEGLDDADFAPFEAVARTATAISRGLTSIDDTGPFSYANANAFKEAVGDVHTLCE